VDVKLFINELGYVPEQLDATIENGKVIVSLDKVAKVFKAKAKS
jgi:hypothetical protein